MGDLEHSVLFVTFSYKDGSELIFKGTRDVSFIASCSPALMSRDCFLTEDKTELKPGIIYDLKIMRFREIPSGCSVSVSKTKQDYKRRLDRFASVFI